MQKMTRLGECYFDLKKKTRMKDGKRKEQMKKGKECKEEVKDRKLSNLNKFCLVTFLS